MASSQIEHVIEAVQEPLVFRRRKQRQDAVMDITPMIDITFLLLIFFLVASRMSDEAFVRLPTARNGTGVASKDSVIVTVAQDGSDAAVFYKGDGIRAENRLRAEDPVDQQRELETYIQQGLTVEGKQQVLIKAEEGVRHRDVARAARAAGDATAEVLYVAVLETR